MAASPIVTAFIPNVTVLPIAPGGEFELPWRKYFQYLGTAVGGALMNLGTVTSVGITTTTPSLVISGSPVTTNGVIELTIVDAPKWTAARNLIYKGDVTGGPSPIDGTQDVTTILTVSPSILARMAVLDGADGEDGWPGPPGPAASPSLPLYIVANLPASPHDGQQAMATDATLTAITGLGLAPTGGGSNKVPVYAAGGGWIML